MAPHQIMCREKLIVRQVPQKNLNSEEEIFTDFGKLEFREGPFSSSDEINYNDGLEGNPFDKIAKAYGRHKDLFLFNAVLSSAEKRAKILEIAEGKCANLEDPADLLAQFKRGMDVYLKRIRGGESDAEEILGGDVDGFFYGCFFSKRGEVRNIHANLNVYLSEAGQSLETKRILTEVTPNMVAENSNLERMKIYGNGKRIMNVVKGVHGERNYSFSKLAKMELEIEWIGRERGTGRDVVCCLVLEMSGGRVGVKMASIDGVALGKERLGEMREFAWENNEVLIRNKSLGQILDEIVGPKEGAAAANGEMPLAYKAQPATKFNCNSKEILTIDQLAEAELGAPLMEDPCFKEILADIEKLDFSSAVGPFDPNDKLNYNEGRIANPFSKLRKFYGREKNIFLLLGFLSNEISRAEIMNVVRGKYGEDADGIVEFERCMNRFLARVEEGRQRAMEFLVEEEGDGQVISSFFAGHFVPDENHGRNFCANLNVDLLGKNGKTFPISNWFGRPTPHPEDEGGELERVKFFGKGNKLLTTSKKGMGPDQRNYLFTIDAEMSLEVEWRAIEEGVERDCLVVLKFNNGNVTIDKATVDGDAAGAQDISELAKQNDKVLFRNKTLYSVCCLAAAGKKDREERKGKPQKRSAEENDGAAGGGGDGVDLM